MKVAVSAHQGLSPSPEKCQGLVLSWFLCGVRYFPSNGLMRCWKLWHTAGRPRVAPSLAVGEKILAILTHQNTVFIDFFGTGAAQLEVPELPILYGVRETPYLGHS